MLISPKGNDTHSVWFTELHCIVTMPIALEFRAVRTGGAARETFRANPLWGAPHIHSELLKLGFLLTHFWNVFNNWPVSSWGVPWWVAPSPRLQGEHEWSSR